MTTAESSPASLSETVASLSPEAHAAWKLTGELPGSSEPTPSTPDADSSPAEPAAPVAETSVAPRPPASEPGTPRKTKNAATRTEELDGEIQTLRDKLAERRRLKDELDALGVVPARAEAPDEKDAASSTAPSTVRPLAEFVERPDLSQPALKLEPFFALYPDADLRDFNRYVSRHETLGIMEQTRRQEGLRAAEQAHREHWRKAQETNPDLRDQLPENFKRANPHDLNPDKPMNYVAKEVFDSAAADRLLLHFASTPGEADRIAALGHPALIIREMARLEARLTSDPVNPQRAVKKTASSAPLPGTTTLGAGARGSVDSADAAIAAGDPARYNAIMNERERSMVRGRV